MPPPPTPASLVDLPGPWLLKLAGSDSFKGDSFTLWRLYRSCTLFRDLVLQQRQATAAFHVPIAAEDFPQQLRRLTTLARHSRDIKLEFSGPQHFRPWTETEPHIAHLLLCAVAQLGGQPLTGVKELVFEHVEQTSVVPMWLPLVCPNVTSLVCADTTITRHLPLPAAPHLPSSIRPAACQHLQRLDMSQIDTQAQHLQQQLAALPSLSSLTVLDTEDLLEQLHSTTLTGLELTTYRPLGVQASFLQRLPVQFPNLVELHAPYAVSVDDDGLEALLSMRGLRRVTVWDLDLERSHAHRPCTWEELFAAELTHVDVDMWARLPLEGIAHLDVPSAWRGGVLPSRDAQAVARVAAAVKRSGCEGAVRGLSFSGEDATALRTTLRPLLGALPAEEQRTIRIIGLRVDLPDAWSQLCQQLTPAVSTLGLYDCTVAPEVLGALLPTLPATVTRLELTSWPDLSTIEEHVLAVCSAAVRPIEVFVAGRLPQGVTARIRTHLAEQGKTHVALETVSM